MIGTEFVRPYRTSIPEAEWRQDSATDLLHDANAQSHDFGVALHHYLAGHDSQIDFSPKYEARYRQWVIKESRDLRHAVLEDVDPHDLKHAFSEYNFHVLNLSMLAMWRPIIEKEWGHRQPDQLLQRARENVAYRCLEAYRYRLKLGTSYFDDGQEERRAVMEGAMEEYDSAIVGLQLVGYLRQRYPHFKDLTIVPAPMQFEHDRARYNADLLMVYEAKDERHAVGIQVKSHVTQKDRERYDPDRIALVGAVDAFKNRKKRRVSDDPNEPRREVSWGGLISAEVARDAKTHGPATSFSNLKELQDSFTPPDPTRIMVVNRFLARELVGTERHRLTTSMHRIAHPIVSRLISDDPRFARR